MYALGCVLYEMLAGRAAVHRADRAGDRRQGADRDAPARSCRSATPSRRTSRPRCSRRWRSSRPTASAPRRLSPTPSANTSFTTQAPASGRGTPATARRRLGLPAAALLGFGGAGARGRRSEAGLAGERAPTTTTRLMLEFPASQQPRLPTFNRPILAQLPDGSGFLYSGPGANTRTQLWIRRWDRFEATRLSQTLDDGCCTVFSPHGDSLAYLAPPHLLHVVPLSGGLPITVADSGLTPVTDYGGGVDWGSDGMLYASGLDGLIRISPRGGKTELVAALDSGRGDLRYLVADGLAGRPRRAGHGGPEGGTPPITRACPPSGWWTSGRAR